MSATEELRTSYIESQVSTGMLTIGEATKRVEALFAAHDREVAERAWREGYYTGKHDYAGSLMGGQSISTPNPYRADTIEAGSDA